MTHHRVRQWNEPAVPRDTYEGQSCGTCRWLTLRGAYHRQWCSVRCRWLRGSQWPRTECNLWDPLEGEKVPTELPRASSSMALFALEPTADGLGRAARDAREGMHRNGISTGDRGDHGDRWM